MTEYVVTLEGYRKLEQEIEHLRAVRLPEVAERIKDAREFGDVAENSEYLDALNDLDLLERRVETLEERLRNVHVVAKEECGEGVVGIGKRVRLRDLDEGDTAEYVVVGSYETDPAGRNVSNRSPLGRAILGRKKGETVEVVAPRGKLSFEILDVKAA